MGVALLSAAGVAPRDVDAGRRGLAALGTWVSTTPAPPGIVDIAVGDADHAWAITASDAWALDGGEWIEVDHPGLPGDVFTSLYARDADHAWLGGYRSTMVDGAPCTCGFLWRWDGAAWTVEQSVIPLALADVAIPADDFGLVVGRSGMPGGARSFQWDGVQWLPVAFDAGGRSSHLAAASAASAWAVGLDRNIGLFRFNAGAWTEWPLGDASTIAAMDMFGDDFGVAVQSDGVVRHWDGSRWQRRGLPISVPLRDVAVASADEGWAVGAGSLLYWDGHRWLLVDDPAASTMQMLDMAGSAGWGVAASFFRYDPAMPGQIATPMTPVVVTATPPGLPPETPTDEPVEVPTWTMTPTFTPEATATPGPSPTPGTPTPSLTPMPTWTLSPTPSPGPSPTRTPTMTREPPSPTFGAMPTSTPATPPSGTVPPTAVASPSPDSSPSPDRTATPSMTPGPTALPSPTDPPDSNTATATSTAATATPDEGSTPELTATPDASRTPDPGATPSAEQTPPHTSTPVIVDLRASGLAFDPTEVMVRAGQSISVVLTIEEGTHDIVFDMGGRGDPAAPPAGGGRTTGVRFQAPTTPGTYVFYCSVGIHRELGMVGRLVVTTDDVVATSTPGVTTTATPSVVPTATPPMTSTTAPAATPMTATVGTTATAVFSGTASATHPPPPTAAATATESPTATDAPPPPPSSTPTHSPTPSPTPSATPSPTDSATPSPTPFDLPSPSPTAAVAPATATPTERWTDVPTATPGLATATATPMPRAETATRVGPTSSPSPAATPTQPPRPSPSPSPTDPPEWTPTPVRQLWPPTLYLPMCARAAAVGPYDP